MPVPGDWAILENQPSKIRQIEMCRKAILLLRSNFYGATDPSGKAAAGMWWVDSNLTPSVLKIRNDDNNGWEPIMEFHASGIRLTNCDIITGSTSGSFTHLLRLEDSNGNLRYAKLWDALV